MKDNPDPVKIKLLNLGSRGKVSFTTMIAVLNILREQLYMIQQWLKAINGLQQIDEQTQRTEPTDDASNTDFKENRPNQINPS